jgi:hypothetical protein
MRAAIPPLPQYVFMALCLVKHRDNFTNFKILFSGSHALPTKKCMTHFQTASSKLPKWHGAHPIYTCLIKRNEKFYKTRKIQHASLYPVRVSAMQQRDGTVADKETEEIHKPETSLKIGPILNGPETWANTYRPNGVSLVSEPFLFVVKMSLLLLPNVTPWSTVLLEKLTIVHFF